MSAQQIEFLVKLTTPHTDDPLSAEQQARNREDAETAIRATLTAAGFAVRIERSIE